EGEVWKGLATLAGSWIGGGANQAALFRIFEPPAEIFAAVVAVGVFVAYGWMAGLLYGADKREQLERYYKVEGNEEDEPSRRMEPQQREARRTPETKYSIVTLGVAFGVTVIAHLLSGPITCFIAQRAPQLDRFSLTFGFF